jgi:hypothetical protein
MAGSMVWFSNRMFLLIHVKLKAASRHVGGAQVGRVPLARAAF